MEEDSPLGWTEVRSSCREGRHLAWMRSTLTLREVKKKKKKWEKVFPGDRLGGKGWEGLSEVRSKETKAKKKTAA